MRGGNARPMNIPMVNRMYGLQDQNLHDKRCRRRWGKRKSRNTWRPAVRWLGTKGEKETRNDGLPREGWTSPQQPNCARGLSFTLAGSGRNEPRRTAVHPWRRALPAPDELERDSGPRFLPVDQFRSPFRGTEPLRSRRRHETARETNEETWNMEQAGILVPLEGLSPMATWGKQMAFHRGVFDFEECSLYRGNAVCSFYLFVLLFYYWEVVNEVTRPDQQALYQHSLALFSRAVDSFLIASTGCPHGFPQHPGSQTDQCSYLLGLRLVSYAGKASQRCTHDDTIRHLSPLLCDLSAAHVLCWVDWSHFILRKNYLQQELLWS